MSKELLSQLKQKMEAALAVFSRELSGLRTGRASVNLLTPIHVDAYGTMTPLQQVAAISCPEPKLITVQVWDRGLCKAVEKAISDSNLGLNPSVDGQLIRVNIPPLTEERRKELVKVAGKYAEESRISIRSIRRDGMDTLKKQEKSSEISEDEMKKYSSDVQKLTDEFIKNIEEHFEAKQKDIMTI